MNTTVEQVLIAGIVLIACLYLVKIGVSTFRGLKKLSTGSNNSKQCGCASSGCKTPSKQKAE